MTRVFSAAQVRDSACDFEGAASACAGQLGLDLWVGQDLGGGREEPVRHLRRQAGRAEQPESSLAIASPTMRATKSAAPAGE